MSDGYLFSFLQVHIEQSSGRDISKVAQETDKLDDGAFRLGSLDRRKSVAPNKHVFREGCSRWTRSIRTLPSPLQRARECGFRWGSTRLTW